MSDTVKPCRESRVVHHGANRGRCLGPGSTWLSRGRRRDGRTNARVRLVADAGRAGGRLAAEPQDGRANHARFALRDVARLGSGIHVLLQRRLRPNDAGSKTSLGTGPSCEAGVAGDLGRTWARGRNRSCGRDRRPGTRACCYFSSGSGFKEESYHTFSYSPVPDDTGRVGGMLCVVTEDTERTIGERRLRTLRELATNTTETVQSAEEACRTAARTLAENPRDLPFALIYLLNSDSATVRLAGAAGLEEGSAGVPAKNRPFAAGRVRKDLAPACRLAQSQRSASCRRYRRVDLVRCRCGVWPESPQQAVVLPLAKPGQTRLAGFLVAGISPRLRVQRRLQGLHGPRRRSNCHGRRQCPGL